MDYNVSARLKAPLEYLCLKIFINSLVVILKNNFRKQNSDIIYSYSGK